jgi:predicted phage baseplate assembly protein
MVYGNFQRAGNLALPALARIDASRVAGNLALAGLNEPLAETAGRFPLLDKRDTGAALQGNVSVDSFGRGLLQVAKSPERSDPFVAPLRVFGNTIPISRGESVGAEVLGSAAAASPFQTFKLQRKPLTYLPSLTAASGYVSTLQIRVNGLLWNEVDSFFGAGPSDQVYIVRHDEAGETAVTFGDGNYGAFPPVGSNNVVATYRTGAGSSKPPAMTIRQAVSPLKRLSQIFNPLGASGGADAENPDQIRTQAAIGALTFGRAVSLADFEAMARSYADIVNAIAGWAWDDALQRAVVTIWYIADGGDPTADLRNWLAARADPAIEISVRPASAIPVDLVTAMDFDPAFDRTAVEARVIAALTDAQSGILSHARAPIGGSIFLSAIFEAVLAVPGVQAITNLTTAVGSGAAGPAPFALTATEGTFLDFLPFDNR